MLDRHATRTAPTVCDVILNVNAAGIGTSAAVESAIAAEIAAATALAAAALMTATPMGADGDSVQFAAALNAAGAAYIGCAGEHLVNRSMFAGAQELAAATYTATDVVQTTALAL